MPRLPAFRGRLTANGDARKVFWNHELTLPTKVLSDSLGQIGSLKRTSDKSLFPMALGSCNHRITHQLRPINMNGRAILSVMSELRFAFDIPYAAMNETSSNRWNLSVISDFSGLANQVATSGHFAPRPTPHAPRSTFAGVRPPLPRAELGIHGLNRWTVKC